MYIVTISRDYEFSAAHRIENHPKCGRLHGHNYKVIVKLTSTVDKSGMVLDYAELDRIVKPILEELDHRYMISETNANADDPYLLTAVGRGDAVLLHILATTAECLCKYIAEQVIDSVGFRHLQSYRVGVKVWETSKSCAEYESGTWPTQADSQIEAHNEAGTTIQ